MVRKPVVLITGASGEIGHGLIESLAKDGRRPIITLDLKPLEVKQLEAIRAELDAEHNRLHVATRTTSEGVSPSRISSKHRT